MIDTFAKPLLEYRQALRAYWKLKDGELPRFDLVLLGMEVERRTSGSSEPHDAARLPVTCGSR